MTTKKLYTMSLGVIATMLPATAVAVTYDIVQTPNAFVTTGFGASGVFDLTAASPAFVPGASRIDSVQISFSLLNFTGADTASFSLETTPVATGFAVDQLITAFNTSDGIASASLAADGLLNWSVELDSGDGFSLMAVALQATTSELGPSRGQAPVEVPDGGGTLALLGLSLMAARSLRGRSADRTA